MLRGGAAFGLGALAGGPIVAGRAFADGTTGVATARRASSSPRQGGTLSVGVPHSVPSFDPYIATLAQSPTVPLYTDLVNYVGEEFDVVGLGLESWTRADDGTEAEIRLHDGQVFHSGRPVTADDLVFMFERAAGDDAGIMAAPVSVVDTVSAVDELTARLVFRQPIADSVFTDMLAQLKLVDRELNSSEQLQTEPGGSGPFRMVEFQPNVGMAMERFDDYFQPDLPRLDRIEFRFFEDAAPMIAGLQSGELDVASFIEGSAAGPLESEFNIVQHGPTRTTSLLVVNPTVPPFDNKLVRQAIQHAINRDRLVQDLFFGYADPITLPFGPGSAIYGGETDFPETAYDLDEAARLLNEAGGDLSGEAIVGSTVQSLQILEVVQADLREIGFDLAINQLEQQTFVERWRGGQFGVTVASAGVELRSPFFKTITPPFRLEDNVIWGEQGLPEAFVEGMNEIQRALDDEALSQAAEKVRQVVIDEAWVFGVAAQIHLTATSPRVHDLGFTGFSSRPFYESTWLEE